MSPAENRNVLSGRLIFRVGAALVLVGMLFLFRYSIEQGWFGPAARLTIGAVTSAAMAAVGTIIQRRLYGRVLQGVGVAGAYATAWAAYARYQLVDETTAFVQLALVAAVGVGLAWRERSDVLAAVGLVAAVAAPVLVGGELSTPFGDVGYQIAVMAIAAGLYLVRAWWITLSVAAAGSGLWLLTELVWGGGDRLLTLAAAVVVWWIAAWLVPCVVAPLMGVAEHLPGDVLAVATFPVSPAAWMLFAGFVPHPAATAAAVVLAAVHGMMWWIHRDRPESGLHLVLGLVFVAIASVAQFQPETAVALFMLAGFATVAVASRTKNEAAVIIGYAGAGLAIAVWAAGLAVADPADRIADLLAVLVAAASVVAVDRRRRFPVAAATYGMAFLWIAQHLGSIDPGWATAGYAAIGTAALVVGRLHDLRVVTGTGLVTLAVAVAKLILVDLAEADPLLKIGLAFGIGLALLAVGFWIGDAALLSADGPREHDTDPEESADGHPASRPAHDSLDG